MVATETEAVMGLLTGVNPFNLFDAPSVMLNDPTVQDKAKWLEAVPKDWHAFKRLLGWWFDAEIAKARARETASGGWTDAELLEILWLYRRGIAQGNPTTTNAGVAMLVLDQWFRGGVPTDQDRRAIQLALRGGV